MVKLQLITYYSKLGCDMRDCTIHTYKLTSCDVKINPKTLGGWLMVIVDSGSVSLNEPLCKLPNRGQLWANVNKLIREARFPK